MVREIKIFEWECEYCHKKVLNTGQRESASRPAGWESIASHGWGMTNYTRHLDACPECYPKHKDEK